MRTVRAIRYLVAPRSAVIQISPVHTGLCDEPAAALDQLLARLVLVQGARISE